MGKIRQLREDQLINGGSQEHIYPITHAKAVYTEDGKQIQKVVEEIKSGKFLEDGVIQTRHLHDGSVSTGKLADSSVVESKIASGAVTTDKIQDKGVTTEKINDLAVTTDKVADLAITTEKINNKAVTEGKLADEAVISSKIKDGAVSTAKLIDKSVTNDKIADSTLTLDKFDDDLKDAIEAATGLPSDILEQFQNLSEDIADLQDSVYPITLSMGIAFSDTYHTINFSVRNKGEAFVGDTLSLTKTLGSGAVRTLTNIPTADGTAQSQVESNREIFKLEVGAKGHTTKSTSATRYICYAGGNAASAVSASLINLLKVYSSPNVAFNPTVTTTNGQYIWIVVPSYLTVNKVTSQGFDVTLQSAGNIATSLGTFKAYRTVNALTTQTWNLVIS